MKEKNNCDKSRLMKLLIVLNMLQRPNCFIIFNESSKKVSTNVNHKNNLCLQKNAKDRMNVEYILPIKQVNIEDDSNFIPPLKQINIEGDSDFMLPLKHVNIEGDLDFIPPLKHVNIEGDSDFIPPLKQVNIEGDSDFIPPLKHVNIEGDSDSIPPICDKLIMSKLLVILKLLQQSSYNEDINKIFKNRLTNIKHKNNLSVQKNTNDKITTKFILPTRKLIIKTDTECIKKEGDINTTPDCIYDIRGSINTNPSKSLVSTFPLIIAEKTIDIPIESTFRLKNAALDIKNMKKDVYLTNSKLIPLYKKDDISPSLNGKLFLEGFVRNKVDSSIAKDVHDGIINLDTESLIIYTPFKCTTLIQYKVPPIFSNQNPLDYIPIYVSLDCLDVNKGYGDYLYKKNIECDRYIDCSVPPINCEIEKAKIYETYTLVDKTPFNKDFPIEINFNTIKENIIINLSLTLLQEQDVAINYKKTK
ncbi:hypothetical protein KTC92_09185 [Clostridium sp. CM027]|uniref:DUF7852 domain-containing protein n=1 Tax=Clostridium sp. CM027 TaxID=2849865 RepID=UPI001C6EDA6C|nr:hypothetical protein [Clostridium sp. CM027]MBW9145449.1 hypothetical protein [Clostridium sp. CM027]UVE39428.1 hypothetical protein KTC92_09185 [Clostridium sp. CM027]